MARALLTHVRHDGLGATRDTGEIDIPDSLDFGFGGLLDCADEAGSGIVDQHVDAAFSSNDLVDRCDDAGAVEWRGVKGWRKRWPRGSCDGLGRPVDCRKATLIQSGTMVFVSWPGEQLIVHIQSIAFSYLGFQADNDQICYD